ncbi:carboxyl transferase domain-containing protein [Patulibacter sp. SYSU D01012]|uniref:carboxyl transferase domain-containing protein n=1 Tax=Patulibacter sp. SYSU D01012 TaxID=2817381 RepID=UPI001B3047DE|nr:carboxyl transferase domain-containing protein [Patulibacter sp. SYSU D01012]
METVETQELTAPVAGAVVRVEVAVGDTVRAGDELLVVESMKTEFGVVAERDGTVLHLRVAPGAAVEAGAPVLTLRPATGAAGDEGSAAAGTAAGGAAGGGRGARAGGADAGAPARPAGAIRPDLAEVRRRQALTRDAARPDVVAKRHARGRRTARENLADLCDPGTFAEYGALAVAAQRSRRPLQELLERTPADGLVCGVAGVNGERVGADRAHAVVLSYDATVLAGTQGHRNHAKTDRMFDLALRRRLPVVLFAEGGGGRPGDTDVPTASWLDVPTFHAFARLSGTVPLVGVASGRCFAGNAALLGCCDVVIATEDATIGMGGPAMIEGGGLGVYAPEEVGPIDVMEENGVVDVTAADDAEAVAVAQEVLSFFQGPVADWRAPDPRALRDVVPERRVRAYDVRRAIAGIADVDGWIELRPAFGTSMVTALVRVEGRPYGLLANDPSRLGGAIDSAAADKAARFLGLCDAHGLPVVALCDTPGFMVGPEAERSGTVRHVSRMFVAGANLTVPLATIVLRKAYGLGAMAMAGGSMKAPLATVGWPTAEMGAMGLEGAVRLGFRAELDAVADPQERQALFDRMVDAAYEHGKGLNAASMFELDDVIDPADTRRWIVAALGDHEPRRPGPGGGADRRPFVDPW